jgi:molybdopterin-guanine dinucleotide biosynthesis protein A
VLFDALVLEGGRSSRLGGVPKAGLVFQGRTLLERTVSAVGPARTIVVVGPTPPVPLPTAVLLAREEPPFAGPAAAVAAGLVALARHADRVAPHTLVLACDMPAAPDVVERLLGAVAACAEAADGFIIVDADGMEQPLAAIYATTALTAAASTHCAAGGLRGLSVRRLIGGLSLVPVHVSGGETDDVDTWEDARRLGVRETSRNE